MHGLIEAFIYTLAHTHTHTHTHTHIYIYIERERERERERCILVTSLLYLFG